MSEFSAWRGVATVIELPGDLNWPPPGAIVQAQRVGQELLLTVTGETRPMTEQP